MVRHVLDTMLMKIGRSQLTHELLVTLMAEVTGIVNSHPIATIPSDTDETQPLTPAMLLTMKTHPLAPTPGQFIWQDLYGRNWWRKAQHLAHQFGWDGRRRMFKTFREDPSGRPMSVMFPWETLYSNRCWHPSKWLVLRLDRRSYQEFWWQSTEG